MENVGGNTAGHLKEYMGKKEKGYKCFLPPFVRQDIMSLQEAKQQAGWWIKNFNLDEAWKYSQGEGIVVAVIDTGVDENHQDLKNNLVEGKNFVNTKKLPIDKNSHGSHCTGTICAENNHLGIVGVAPKCKVMPIKVLDDNGSGDMRNVAAGIRYAVAKDADIISMSLGSPTSVKEVHQAIQFAESKGKPTFVAAGNAGKTKQIFFPAAYQETIGIGACDINLNRASFSCTGDDLDFLAPGVDILSTVPPNWYANMQGTSMATPFAVGVAALVLSYVRRKKLNIRLGQSEDYRKLLKNFVIHTKDKATAGKKFYEGYGIIDTRLITEWAKKNQ